MIKVFWGTRLRGFFKHISNNLDGVEFISTNYYETNSIISKWKSKLIRNPILNFFGVFKVINQKKEDCDLYGSFNRFLNVDKPYFIYLENPTALYHYVLNRIKYPIGRKRFFRCLNDKNLKYIICMSRACELSFEKINLQIPSHIKIRTIYPLVPNNKIITKVYIEEKSKRKNLEVLFCVQGIRFVSKGGLEVISAINKLCDEGNKIHLNIITKINDLAPTVLDKIQRCKYATLNDFNFSYEQLEKIYAETNILLQPASDESFGMTVLEAMKGGCAIIASELYAFSEMVIHGTNGFLVEPKYWFFDQNNIPNPKVWNHRKKTIYSYKESEKLIEDISFYLKILHDDRNILKEFCNNSLELANKSEQFSEESICSQWKEFLEDMIDK